MAPRKEKSERVSKADTATDMVVNYLRKQNRPYSATDISANLHNKVTKAAAVKILKDLRERKEIEGRDSGKQSVYHVIQNPNEAPSPEDLAEMDQRTQAFREETTHLNITAKSLRSTLSSLNSTMSTADLRASVAAMEVERAEILARLTALRAGTVQPVSKEEKDEVNKQARAWEKVVTTRKKIVKDMWGSIVEGLPEGIKAEELREDFGLTDD